MRNNEDILEKLIEGLRGKARAAASATTNTYTHRRFRRTIFLLGGANVQGLEEIDHNPMRYYSQSDTL